MATVTSNSRPDQDDPDHRAGVVKAALLAAASFITAVGTLLAVAGEWRTPDETVRYAITVAGVITAFALGIAAIYVWPRK
ncbi:hypothetical protein AB0C12_22825 [Actinoplanes sp. NPDC048967]|uniref:hypothetical protein n=1 Tax=Actinoplanes sp. NPDC048967 TaxID=3155269 RepID=UPI0033CE84AE